MLCYGQQPKKSRLTLANRIINKEIEQVAIDLLKHHPRNANHGDVDAIKKSLAVNGWYGSVVVNTATKHILAGNHRVMAAKALGWETVPVQWVDVTPEEELRILVVDNRTTRIGQDDTTKITDILAELANTPVGLDGTGYSAVDLDALISELSGVADETPEFEDKEFSNQYGVIITCESEQEQEVVYNKLLGEGYTVKVVMV
jgi:ParB-like chromosome segregation protein Spo0J